MFATGLNSSRSNNIKGLRQARKYPFHPSSKRAQNRSNNLLLYLRCKHAVLLSVRTRSAGSLSAESRRNVPPALSSPTMFVSLASSKARVRRSLQRAGSLRPRENMASELHATIVSLKAFLVAEFCRGPRRRQGYGGRPFYRVASTYGYRTCVL